MSKKTTTWRQAQKEVRKKEATALHSDICNDCLRKIAIGDEQLGQVGAEVFESLDGAHEVWLTADLNENGACRVLGLTDTGCLPQAELIADAVRAFLNTPHGQQQAVQYIKHRVNQFHGSQPIFN